MVTQASYVGQVPHGGEVYCVDKIGIIPLTPGSGIYSEIIGLEVSGTPIGNLLAPIYYLNAP